jgi:hypothetical protein
MEYLIKEDDPPQTKCKNTDLVWKQGYFSFGNQSRIANLTAVKFITNDILVIAHRAVAKLYLVQVDEKICTTLDSIVLKQHGKYYHPDGMDLYINKVYMTAFTDQCCVVSIVKNKKLVIDKIFEISPSINYHGVLVNGNELFFGGCNPPTDKKTMSITVLNKKGDVLHLDSGFFRRIKGISLYKDDFILVVSDDKREGHRNIFHSYVVLYRRTNEREMVVVDELCIKNSQVDGVSMLNNRWFATLHSADDKCGYIVEGEITPRNTIKFLKNNECGDFPHGIDIFTNNTNKSTLMAFTSYGSSTFTINEDF